MALTEKQKKVIIYAQAHDNHITKAEAMALINDYYHNGSKHVGDVLSRMVNSGLLVRVSPGKFKTCLGTRNKPATIINNQPNLF